jgi:hypothetical protein
VCGGVRVKMIVSSACVCGSVGGSQKGLANVGVGKKKKKKKALRLD